MYNEIPKIIHPPVKEAPANPGDASKVRDFVEVIDRPPLLVWIVDHFCGSLRRSDVSDNVALRLNEPKLVTPLNSGSFQLRGMAATNIFLITLGPLYLEFRKRSANLRSISAPLN